jgi:hypothetical protein
LVGFGFFQAKGLVRSSYLEKAERRKRKQSKEKKRNQLHIDLARWFDLRKPFEMQDLLFSFSFSFSFSSFLLVTRPTSEKVAHART